MVWDMREALERSFARSVLCKRGRLPGRPLTFPSLRTLLFPSLRRNQIVTANCQEMAVPSPNIAVTTVTALSEDHGHSVLGYLGLCYQCTGRRRRCSFLLKLRAAIQRPSFFVSQNK